MQYSLFLLALFFVQTVFADPIVNSPISLNLTKPAEPSTDGLVFDESVIFAPNFAINQNSTPLADLFSDQHTSNLCFPSSLAEALVYLYTLHAPAYKNLKLAGLSADQTSLNPDALVRQLATLCQTDHNSGTYDVPAASCIASIFSESGYGLGNTKLISPFDTSAAVPLENRMPTVSDIRDALQAGDPVLLEVAWYKWDVPTKTWIRDSGHYVSVFGYDYDESWGENQIQLKIINPETNYGANGTSAVWDTVTMIKYSPQAGTNYPANRQYIMTGAGFGGLTERGFVGLIFRVSPSAQ